MESKIKPMTNQQYCLINSQYARLSKVAAWSTLADVKQRRDRVLRGKASARGLIRFLNLEIGRLESMTVNQEAAE